MNTIIISQTRHRAHIWGSNLLAQQEMYLLGRGVDSLVRLGQCQLRGVLLVYLEHDVAQANARFVGQSVGGHLQGCQPIQIETEIETKRIPNKILLLSA